jgi:hypothetical protein
MVCKADTRFTLVRVERPYFQCSLLLMLFCTEVLIVGGYKLVERGITPMSLCVSVFECLSVCLVHCCCWALSNRSFVEGLSLPFYSMQREGQITICGCTKIKGKGPKVLLIPSFPLSSYIRTVVVVVVACRGCRCITVDAARPYPDMVS